MITIEMLMDETKEEICGAIGYAKLALEYKYTRPALSEVYMKLAPVELTHTQLLKEMVSRIVTEEKGKGAKFPDDFEEK